MKDNDILIWQLIQDNISRLMSEGKGELDILEEIMRITHGLAEYNSIRREIIRQKRMMVN